MASFNSLNAQTKEGKKKEDAINRERLGLKFMEPIQVLIPNSQTLGFNLAGAWVGEGATVVSPVYNVRYAEESAEIAVVEDGDDMVDAAFMTDKLCQMTSKTYVAFEKHGECSPEFPPVDIPLLLLEVRIHDLSFEKFGEQQHERVYNASSAIVQFVSHE